MTVHRTEDAAEHQKELNIFVRSFSRLQKVNAVVCGERPVVVLTGTIHTGKRLLMKQALESVLLCHPFQSLHDNLVMVGSHVALLIDRSQLMLSGSYLVVLCLGRNAQLPEFFIHILHESANPLTDDTEIMVIQLLALRRHCSKQGSSGKDQVFSLEIFLMIHNEILLLHTYGRKNLPGSRVSEKTKQT